MSRGILALSGYNFRAIIAFCRWASSENVPFHLIARNHSDPVFLTDYADCVTSVREKEQLTATDVIQWIKSLKAQFGYTQVLLLPSTEYFNRLILSSRSELEAAGGIVPLCHEDLYIRISDKWSFGEMCAAHGLDIPHEVSLDSDLPIVAKPRSYGNSTGEQIKPVLIHTPEDRMQFAQSNDTSHYYFQEFVTGSSLYLLLHISSSGHITACSQENHIQQCNGGSIIMAKPTDLHHTAICSEYCSMLVSSGFHGLIMIELRQTADNRYVMIEANPRMWGPMALITDNGVPIFNALLSDYGWTIPQGKGSISENKVYFWSGGISGRNLPLAYHNFSQTLLIKELQQLLQHDIYNRKDTRPLWKKEYDPAALSTLDGGILSIFQSELDKE